MKGFLVVLPAIVVSWFAKHYANNDPTLSASCSPYFWSQVDCFPNGWLQRPSQKACILSSAVLLLAGGWQILQLEMRGEERPKLKTDGQTAKASFMQICSVALPVYATLKIGGFLVAVALSLAMAAGVPTKIITGKITTNSLQEQFRQRRVSAILLAGVIVLAFLGLNQTWDHHPFSGNMALFLSVFTIRPPFSEGEVSRSAIAGADNAVLGVFSGAVLAVLAIVLSIIGGGAGFGVLDILYTIFVASIIAFSFILAPPSTSLRSAEKSGLAVGLGCSAILCAARPGDSIYVAYLLRAVIAAMSFFAARYDDRQMRHDDHDHVQTGVSKMTELVLAYSEPYTLLHSIVKERDSRRIFYFMW